ncbi:hypothetical protein diail_9363, partial [Diaporthe ilicicola]
LTQLARFVLLTAFTAPPNYQWQFLLEKRYPAYAPVSSTPGTPRDERDLEKEGARQGEDANSKPKLNVRNTLIKWFVDCMTVGALLNTLAFLFLMGLMKGQNMEKIGRNVRAVVFADTLPQETIPIIVAGMKIWPIASIISFSFVPVEKRLVFLSFIGFLWGIYMSLVAAEI